MEYGKAKITFGSVEKHIHYIQIEVGADTFKTERSSWSNLHVSGFDANGRKHDLISSNFGNIEGSLEYNGSRISVSVDGSVIFERDVQPYVVCGNSFGVTCSGNIWATCANIAGYKIG